MPPPHLADLLTSLFDAGELRRFVARDYPKLTNSLPGEVPFDELAFRAGELFRRHGLVTETLRDRLIAERPERRDEIEAYFPTEVEDGGGDEGGDDDGDDAGGDGGGDGSGGADADGRGGADGKIGDKSGGADGGGDQAGDHEGGGASGDGGHGRRDLARAFFVVGAVTLLVALFLAIYGFVNSPLDDGQREILRWLFSLSAGFAAGGFLGGVTVRGNLKNGLGVGAGGGGAVWLLTFLLSFPAPLAQETFSLRVAFADEAGRAIRIDGRVVVVVGSEEHSCAAEGTSSCRVAGLSADLKGDPMHVELESPRYVLVGSGYTFEHDENVTLVVALVGGDDHDDDNDDDDNDDDRGSATNVEPTSGPSSGDTNSTTADDSGTTTGDSDDTGRTTTGPPPKKSPTDTWDLIRDECKNAFFPTSVACSGTHKITKSRTGKSWRVGGRVRKCSAMPDHALNGTLKVVLREESGECLWAKAP